ncbi:transposase family protein [Streptococcus danieliae]|nr:transposase family protein [Streptococcus danieliae]
MLEILTVTYQARHYKGGHKPKMSLEDILMATLQYLREYRTYEQIAADFGVHESNLIRRSHWVEETLVQNGFAIGKREIKDTDTLIVDATEVRIQRPKKTKVKLFWQKENSCKQGANNRNWTRTNSFSRCSAELLPRHETF